MEMQVVWIGNCFFKRKKENDKKLKKWDKVKNKWKKQKKENQWKEMNK